MIEQGRMVFADTIEAFNSLYHSQQPDHDAR